MKKMYKSTFLKVNIHIRKHQIEVQVYKNKKKHVTVSIKYIFYVQITQLCITQNTRACHNIDFLILKITYKIH